ncbi:hypothetical protein LQF12_09110 [Ruania suaedae]|uniref:sodium:calcium antiporter n=1 Tax=Ruania suaedae TaxID=2897774 RepID=UPI001E34EA01|nr:hypothetical protein [Ruania suaedae]UFU01686.1 hypothetical protein LQF12_09110 [Ruania suaedae]
MWPLLPSALALLAMAAVIVVAGVRLTRVADALAERTGLGDAIGGALLLGAVTSLPGNVTVATGALSGDAAFALANPVGGVALQTVWLAIADLVYRRVNLEHAAASLQNVLQSVLLLALLAVPVIAYATPTLMVGWVHVLTLAIPLLYGYGLVLLRQMQRDPMWQPTRTAQTADDDSAGENPEETAGDQPPLRRLWFTLAGLGVIVGVAGWIVGRAGLSLVAATGLEGGLVGFTFTTAISSLPELVVLMTAVRMGQLTLGIGNIVGGNVYDMLMLALADVAYLEGSVYSAAGQDSLILVGGTLLITAILIAGLLARHRRGIGFEGVSIPVIYLSIIALMVWA